MEQAQPIRIAQVLNKMDNGGIEAVVMNYYRHIDRSKIQFDFYFAEDSLLPQKEELENLGAGLYPIPSYTKVKAYQKALQKAFRERRYQIVHAHLNTMSVFPLFAAWRAGVPVRICHNHTTAHWGEGKRTLLKYLLRPFAKLFATDYFACGEIAGKWLFGKRCFQKGKVHIMPNAIDGEKFAYDENARRTLRKELGIAEDAYVIGHVGRFMYQKNHVFLIDVFAALKKSHQNAILLLVGEGPLFSDMQEKVQALHLEQSVIFTGPRQDVPKLYSTMDVFCLPSFYEGLPVVCLEAQANGLPVVCSDNVTREAAVTPLVQYLSLEEPSVWCSHLLSQRSSTSASCSFFQIKQTAEQLFEFYQNTSAF